MTGNIHGSDFYKQIAMSKADINKNGQIDEAEYELNGRKINEKSIFEAELKKFDMNQDGVVDDKDVPMLKNKVELTESEQNNEKALREFKEQHPNFDVKTASKEDVDAYSKLLQGSNFIKRLDSVKFNEDVLNTAKYMLNNNSDKFDDYQHSIYKKLSINANVDVDKIGEVQKQMEGLTLFVGSLLMSPDKNNETDKIKFGNSLATRVINTADMATDDMYVQKSALLNLNILSTMGVDNKEIIEDVKNNLRNIKSNYEQELQNTKDADDKQWLQERIADIDKLLK